MADVSGMVLGLHQGQQDAQARQMSSLAMEEGRYKIQKEAIEVKQAQVALDSQQNMLRLMSTMGQGGQQNPASAATSMADAMDELGRMALSSGLPEQAKQYAQTATNIRANQSTIEKNQQTMLLKNADLTERLMSGVHDQNSFDQALANFTAMTGQPSRYAGQRYTPELAQQIRGTAQSLRERVVTQRAEAQTRESEARAKEAQARVPLIRAQTREADAREAKLRKSGGENRIPKSGQITAVTDLMNREFDIAPEEQSSARAIARPIAEDMNQMMQDNPALTQSAAAQRAYQAAKNRGDFGGMTKKRDLPGESAGAAIPLPADKAKLKNNKWYLVQGLPRLLMDGQFYSPEELSASGMDQGDEDTSDDENDEPAREE